MSNYNAVFQRDTEKAPKFAESSQTVAFSHYNNLSAQLPIDNKTGKLVDGGIKEQAIQCFENIKTVIESIGHVLNDVVRISIFISDMRNLASVDEVYSEFFQSYMPTRTVVGVDSLPMNALIQVEALITCGEGTIPNAPQAGDLVKLINNTINAPICELSTQTVAFSHYNNITTQLPIDPKVGRIVADDVRGQTRQCLNNVKAILQSIDVPLDDIVKTNIYVKNLADMDAVDEVYCTFFPDSAIAREVSYMPARTVIPSKELPMNALVQVEVVVSHGDGTPPQAIEDRHGIVIKPSNTKNAPICKLSTQTVAFSHYNHISAQLPIDPQTDKLVSGGIKEQTTQCLNNIKAIVESINHKMADTVKINIFLKNMSDLEIVNEAYSAFYPGGIPARRVVGVSELPMGALIQIDAVISNEEGTPPKK